MTIVVRAQRYAASHSSANDGLPKRDARSLMCGAQKRKNHARLLRSDVARSNRGIDLCKCGQSIADVYASS